MILSFKEKFPWGEETFFPEKILYGVGQAFVDLIPFVKEGKEYPVYKPKLHTIREGHRIKPGTLLHMATGVRSKNYNQFNKGIDELQFCKSTQRFDLVFRTKDHVIVFIDKKVVYVKRPDAEFDYSFMERFAHNDGFESVEQFFKWFNKPVRDGIIIHWTDLKY